jgi:hypothetical protein
MNEKLVITLLQIHTPESAILEIIQNPKNKFSFSYSQGNVKALNDAGVTPKIFFAMYNPAAQAPAPSVEPAPAPTPAPSAIATNQPPVNAAPVSPHAVAAPAAIQPLAPSSSDDASNDVKGEKQTDATGQASAKTGAPGAGAASTCDKPPTTPTLSGKPMKGDLSVSGKAQAKQNSCFDQVKIFVCVSETQPTDSKLDCSSKPSVQMDIEPADGASPVQSVTANLDGTFTAPLVNPLKAGSYLYVTEMAIPTSNPKEESLTASSTPVQVNAVFSKTAPLGVAAAGLDIEGAASVSASPVFLALGLIDLPLMNRHREDHTKNCSDSETDNGSSAQSNNGSSTGTNKGSSAPANNGSDSKTKNCSDTKPNRNGSVTAKHSGSNSAPLDSDIANARWWLGTDIRVSGMAQPGGLSGSDASEAALGGYLATALTANPDNIVKSIDSAAYLAWSPGWNWHLPIGTFDVGDFNTAHLKAPETLVTLSLIASAGVITPLSASEAAPPVYDITSQVYQYLQKNLSNLPGSSAVPTTCQPGTTGSSQCYVSFIPADRSHFYRNYSAGFRFKFYPGDYDDNEYRFPGKADFTIGQNEYVTGGRMSRWVVHTGAVMPVPKLDGWYIFGSTDTEFTKNGQESTQLLLVTAPPTAGLTYSSPNVYGVTVPEPNRDRYSIGFAVDLGHLYSAYQKKQKQTAAANTSQQ